MILDYADSLIEKNGIYLSKKKSDISYPEEANDAFFYVEENSFWFKHRNNCILEVVKKYNGDRLFFDIGGGNGFVSKFLQDHSVQSVLIEPGLAGCLNAQKRGIKHVICSTLENADFRENKIPSIGLFDVVEHIEDDMQFLAGVHRLLQENGLVFITVPAYNFLWSSEDVDAGHFRRYTLKSLKKKLHAVGFEIEFASYIFSVLPLIVFLFRTLPDKFRKKKKKDNGYEKDHNPQMPFVMSLLNRLWQFELKSLGKQNAMPFGGSCLIVAKKKTSNL